MRGVCGELQPDNRPHSTVLREYFVKTGKPAIALSNNYLKYAMKSPWVLMVYNLDYMGVLKGESGI